MTRRKTAGMRQMIPDNSFIHQKTTIMKKYMFFCALLTALNSFAKTGDTFSDGGVTYQVIATSEGGGEVAVHSLDPSASLTDALIPSAVSDGGVLYDVTSVSPEAFRGSALRTVVLPEGVTAIERAAFQNCSLLTEVTLPSSLTSIGDFAFAGCASLTSILLPQDVAYIGRQAFAGCASITQVAIPDGIETIGEDAFLNCSALISVSLPDNMAGVGEGMFEMCGQLEDISLPEGVQYIDSHAFSGCGALASITLPETLAGVGESAFAGCKELASVTIPQNVTGLPDGAFAYCSRLKSVTLPNSVTAIGSGVFRYDQALTHVTLPSWLETIGTGDLGGVFERCDAMTELTIPASVRKIGKMDSFAFGLNSIYVMGDVIPDGLQEMGSRNRMGEDITIYVKRSVYNEKYSSGEWNGFRVDYRIPIKMVNAKGNAVKYKTLCRDFDVDLRHSGDDLSDGTKRLSAYVVDDADGELGMVFMDEILYIPSRLMANVDGYAGEDRYVGVVVRGTPGSTYYYEIGENDYSQGAEGQWLLADAQAVSMTAHAGSNMMRGISDSAYILPAEVDSETGVAVTNYGLNNNAFRKLSGPGWMGYNRSYLPLPEKMAGTNFSMTFTDVDGTTDTIGYEVFINDCDGDDFYDLSGRRTAPTAKGVIVQKGRKVLK